jgi:hypothetical protein
MQQLLLEKFQHANEQVMMQGRVENGATLAITECFHNLSMPTVLPRLIGTLEKETTTSSVSSVTQ